MLTRVGHPPSIIPTPILLFVVLDVVKNNRFAPSTFSVLAGPSGSWSIHQRLHVPIYLHLGLLVERLGWRFGIAVIFLLSIVHCGHPQFLFRGWQPRGLRAQQRHFDTCEIEIVPAAGTQALPTRSRIQPLLLDWAVATSGRLCAPAQLSNANCATYTG